MRNRAVSAFLTIIFAAVTCAGVGLTASRASAVFQELTETGKPGYLVLALDSGTPLNASLSPGDSMRWLVKASLRDSSTSTLSFELEANGDLLETSGLVAEVATCSGEFDIGVAPVRCQGLLSSALPPTPLALVAHLGNKYELAELQQDSPRQFLVTLTIPAATAESAVEGQTLSVGLGVHASGDGDSPPSTVVPVTPSPPQAALAATGADVLALGVLAAGLIGLGLLAALHNRTTHQHGRFPAGGAQ